MEHSISRETMQRILEHFEDPQTCPHGNPFPGYEDLAEEWIPLTQAHSQQTAVIRRVHESLEEKEDVMVFLEDHHLMPGTQVEVIEIIPFNETVSLCVDGRPVVLGFAIAQAIFIQTE
jgi:DtxR family Mn-dependent transcriptional regulator